jgi:hypothetical protein
MNSLLLETARYPPYFSRTGTNNNLKLSGVRDVTFVAVLDHVCIL